MCPAYMSTKHMPIKSKLLFLPFFPSLCVLSLVFLPVPSLVLPISLLALTLVIPICLLIDINAQARKLQRNRAKGTLTLPRSSNSSLCRSLSETSLNQVGPPHTQFERLIVCFPGAVLLNQACFLACTAWSGR